MSFVSYAQNFEDVMLWRALKHVANGFYIDVGANDPSSDSVTKAFYERGWSGINIEPLPSHYSDLQLERPRDINLQYAAGVGRGEIKLWECDVRGWATADETVITRHRKDGHEGVFHTVPVLPLSEICADNVSGEVHFLKIDVEGFEKTVIEGMDFSRCRPWILVIEATRPNSTEEVYADWESIILSGEYVFAYSDGLNRFYVAKEHLELLPTLRYPPNVLDGFIRAGEFYSELCAQQAEAKAQQAEAKAQQAEAKAQHAETKVQHAETKVQHAETKVQHAEAKVQQAEAKAQHAEAKAQHAEAVSNECLTQLNAVYTSTSWRITKPLRAIKRVLTCDFAVFSRLAATVKLKAKKILRPIVSAGVAYVYRRPAWRNSAKRCVLRLPSLHRRLLRIAVNTGVLGGGSLSPLVSPSEQRTLPIELHSMTPRARQIFQELRVAIKTKKEGAAKCVS